METLTFKTNIKCSGCIAAVTPHLNAIPEITHWEVNTESPDKILTVEAKEMSDAPAVIETLAKAGYKAEQV